MGAGYKKVNVFDSRNILQLQGISAIGNFSTKEYQKVEI